MAKQHTQPRAVNAGGRKQKVAPLKKGISFDALDAMAHMGATQTEIAAYFNMSIGTLAKRVDDEVHITLREYIARNYAKGNLSLRRKLYALALKGDIKALLFFARSRLGMDDRNGEQVDVPTAHEDVWDLTKLSKPELEALLVLQSKARGEQVDKQVIATQVVPAPALIKVAE